LNRATAGVPPDNLRPARSRVGLILGLARNRRLAAVAALAATLFYLVRGLGQLAGLPHADLTYDFGQFWNAARALNLGTDPYAPFLKQCPVRFCPGPYIYSPLYAEMLRPLAALPLPVAGGITLVLMQACVVASILLLHNLVRDWITTASKCWILAGTLLFFPLLQALFFIQVIPLLCALLAATAWLYVRGQETRAGLILGVAAVLRISPLLQLPALLVERRQLRRPFGVLAGVGCVGLLLLILAIATPRTAEFFSSVAPRLALGSPELDNVSPNGLLARLEVLAPGILPFSAARLAGAVSLVVVALTWWLALGPTDAKRRALVFAAFLAAAPLVGSITEPYHLTTELLVIALAAACLTPGSVAWWLALASYPLMWVDGHITNPLALSLGLANPHGWRVPAFLLLTSSNLWGALLLWIACLLALARSRAPAGRLSESPGR